MGKSSNTKVLLLIAVFVLGIYVLPSAVAKYAGSHTWELNETGRVTSLQCGICHTYIKNEISASITNDVAFKHMNASNNSLFVGPGATINISFTPTGSLDDVCWMCHVAQNEYASLGQGGHTKVVIRACTDLDCHGDQTGTTMCLIYTSGLSGPLSSCNITGLLNSSADAHWNFYRPLETNFITSIGNENASLGNYRAGFFACMGCHTHLGMDLNITRPQKVSLWLNLTDINIGFNATNFTVNMTNMTSVVGGKEPVSVFL